MAIYNPTIQYPASSLPHSVKLWRGYYKYSPSFPLALRFAPPYSLQVMLRSEHRDFRTDIILYISGQNGFEPGDSYSTRVLNRVFEVFEIIL